MSGGLGRPHRDGARGCIDVLGLVAVGIALPPGGALIKAGPEKPFALDQMFHEGLDRPILSLVHLSVSMVVLRFHGIPEWAALAGARPGRGSWRPRQMNFQT